MFLLSLLSNSAAETVLDSPLPCRGARVTATLPREGQTNVPLDITPALLWSDDCGEGGVVTVTLELDDEEATLVYEGSVTTSGGETGMERITLPETLSPNTDYWLTLRDDRRTTEVPFTTGSTLTQGAQPPVVLSVAASTETRGEAWWLETKVRAEPGSDPDDSSVLLLVDEDGGILDASLDDPARLSFEETRLSQPEEGCVLLAQEDGRGQRSEVVEACAEAHREWGRGCSAAGLSASLALALSGLLLLRRRRPAPDGERPAGPALSSPNTTPRRPA
jgi:uncharacterized protein (TIGR03382 family)